MSKFVVSTGIGETSFDRLKDAYEHLIKKAGSHATLERLLSERLVTVKSVTDMTDSLLNIIKDS